MAFRPTSTEVREMHGSKSDREILLFLIEQEGANMAAIDDLNAAISKLTTDVDQLISLQQAANQDPAIASATQAVTTLDTAVQLVTNPPATTPPTPAPPA